MVVAAAAWEGLMATTLVKAITARKIANMNFFI